MHGASIRRADRGARAGQGGRAGALRGAAVRDREKPAAGGGTDQGRGPPGSACSTACHARGWPGPVRRRRRRLGLGPLPTAPTVDGCAGHKIDYQWPNIDYRWRRWRPTASRRCRRATRPSPAASTACRQSWTCASSDTHHAIIISCHPPRPAAASLTHHSIDVPTAEPGIRACVWKPELVVVVCVLPVPHALRRSTCSRASSEPAVSILASVHID
eukprot:COSAG01_NODE_3968_length_5483_cov_4.305906_6_plen_216_part_00